VNVKFNLVSLLVTNGFLDLVATNDAAGLVAIVGADMLGVDVTNSIASGGSGFFLFEVVNVVNDGVVRCSDVLLNALLVEVVN